MSKRRTSSGWMLASMLAVGEAAAEERLTIEEAVSRGLALYPSIQASMAQVEAAQAAIDEAEAARFPTVSVGASATRYRQRTIVYPIHGFTPNLIPPFDRTLFQLLADLRYPLFDGGARSARIEESRARAQAAQTSFADVRQRILSRIIQEYLRALSLARTLEASDRSLEALELELARVKQVFEVGRAATIDVLRVEAAIAAARAEKVRVDSSLDVAQMNLGRLIGADPVETRASNLSPVSLAEKTLGSREQILESALASNPQVQRARDDLAVAEAVLHGSRSRRLPTVNVDGRTINYGSASSGSSLEWNLGVSLAYPVFTGGAVSSAIARSQATAREASERLKAVELDVASDVDGGLAAIAESEARIESLTTAVNRYAEVSRIEKLRLDTGAGIETDYIRAEADRLAAEAGLIETQYGEIAARAELARAMGILSPDWVEANLRSER